MTAHDDPRSGPEVRIYLMVAHTPGGDLMP